MTAKTDTLLILLFGLGLAGCSSSAPSPVADDPTEVQTYAVPVGQTEVLAEALNEVLDRGQGDASFGHASPRVPGQLLVRAPQSVHASVADALKALAEGEAGREVQPHTLRVWRVEARPGPDQDLGRLETITPALDALRQRFPGLGLALVEESSLAVPATMGQTQLHTGPGGMLSVRSLPGGVPTFDVEFDSPARDGGALIQFQSRLELPHGQTLVAAILSRDPSAESGASVLLLRLEAETP